MPQFLDPEPIYGACIVDEEIPPNWEEDTKEKIEPTGIGLPLNYLEVAMGGCVVEEEIPPQMQDDFMQGATPNFNRLHNDAPGIDWDDC
jgi:hypothetical protein